MNKILLFFACALPASMFSQTGIGFISESIDFTVSPDKFSVNGIYTFVNYSQKVTRQGILFPLPKNIGACNIERVFNLTGSENIDYRVHKNQILFRLMVFPGDTMLVNISYSQKTDKENCYILQSANTWGKPLQSAKYSLSVIEPVRLDSLSMVPDRFSNNTYFWEKNNFVPDTDFIVWIK
ncbi:MAG: DUF4424 family protein [Bacteroidales bacterium]|nr:DUF4424 family protein [Bacteroidales bacterium]